MAKQTAVKELTDGELIKALDQTKEELFNLRFQMATGQLDNHARMGQVRRQVARINTEIREREIAAAESMAANEEAG